MCPGNKTKLLFVHNDIMGQNYKTTKTLRAVATRPQDLQYIETIRCINNKKKDQNLLSI